MLDAPNYNKIDQTKQELDAGLREKILEYREVEHHANDLLQEIATIIKERGLCWNTAMHLTPAYPEKNYI